MADSGCDTDCADCKASIRRDVFNVLYAFDDYGARCCRAMVAAGAAAYAAVEVDMWQAAYAVVGLNGHKTH